MPPGRRADEDSALDGRAPSPDSGRACTKSGRRQVRIVFGVATVLSIFSTLQSYRLNTISIREPMDVEVWRLLILNSFGYWYVPAALTAPIFRLTHRFPIESARRVRTLVLYGLGGAAFSVVHLACTMIVVVSLWPRTPYSFATRAQRIYLTNLDWALMTYSAIVGLSYALGYYRESQARALKAAQLEASLAEARFRTLEAELHPHFLFNTLHAISTLIHTQPDAADRMITRLSDLLRMTFARSGGALVPLHEELEFLQKYPGDRTDPVSGSAHGRLRNRSRHARRGGASPDPSAARGERDQARRGTA